MHDSKEKNELPKLLSLTEALRETSQGWSETEWEAYLRTLEIPLRETLTRKYDDLAEALEAPDPNASQLTEKAMLRLQDAISQLSPKQRTVIQATFWEGLSTSEIARRYGMGRTTVQMHTARAITRLKHLLSANFPLSERAKNRSPHNACPARTKTEEDRNE